jgi:NIMA (never in mitosis gene a)-related kinase
MSLSDFKIIAKLGTGAYSSVYKVERITDGEVYALKKANILGMNDK